ncbi:hypothetical protein IFR05_013466 [Cadophora sp. M221]|nr:hypothetical protein IFR05_013466 [Cadophora sp. M221]
MKDKKGWSAVEQALSNADIMFKGMYNFNHIDISHWPYPQDWATFLPQSLLPISKPYSTGLKQKQKPAKADI